MKPSLIVSAAFCLLIFAPGLSPAQDEKTPTPKGKSPGSSEYYPLAVNTRWEYKTSEGTVTIQVMKWEEIGGKTCAQLVATSSDNKKTTEYVRITDEGIYRVQASGQNITPPLRFLKLPAQDGDTWTVESKVLGKTLKGTFKASVGEVTVGGKMYKDVVISRSDDFTVDGQKVSHAYYLAPNVGIIKQVVTFAGQEITLELVKFTPAS